MADLIRDDRARQGPKGRPVLAVLLGSLVLLGIALFSLMAWIGNDATPQASQEAAREAADPSTTSSANTRGVPAANPAYPAPANRTAEPARSGETTTPTGGPAPR